MPMSNRIIFFVFSLFLLKANSKEIEVSVIGNVDVPKKIKIDDGATIKELLSFVEIAKDWGNPKRLYLIRIKNERLDGGGVVLKESILVEKIFWGDKSTLVMMGIKYGDMICVGSRW